MYWKVKQGGYTWAETIVKDAMCLMPDDKDQPFYWFTNEGR